MSTKRKVSVMSMRLNPGITLEHADAVLRRVETMWSNARNAQDFYTAYTGAIGDTYPVLKQTFAAPDLGAGLHSTAYWNLLSIGNSRINGQPRPQLVGGRVSVPGAPQATRAENDALRLEIEEQIKALEQARSLLEELKKLAARPGLPVVYDTNMLNHWRQPSDFGGRRSLSYKEMTPPPRAWSYRSAWLTNSTGRSTAKATLERRPQQRSAFSNEYSEMAGRERRLGCVKASPWKYGWIPTTVKMTPTWRFCAAWQT